MSRLCVPGCHRAPRLRGPPECAGDTAPWSRLGRVDRTATENVADSFAVGASAPKRHCALKAGRCQALPEGRPRSFLNDPASAAGRRARPPLLPRPTGRQRPRTPRRGGRALPCHHRIGRPRGSGLPPAWAPPCQQVGAQGWGPLSPKPRPPRDRVWGGRPSRETGRHPRATSASGSPLPQARRRPAWTPACSPDTGLGARPGLREATGRGAGGRALRAPTPHGQ